MSQNDPKAFRNALGQFATGVTVVTTVDENGNRIGMTANSFSSVSLDPMLVLWSVAKNCKVFREFNEAQHFAIHVLRADQMPISNQFASSCEDRFTGIETTDGIGGVPLLTDYCALFECELEARHDGGDHVILVGKVLNFHNRGDTPLIFHAGRYADLDQPVAI